MINKKSIWFITLFTLILVLSVYYVTMPSELLLTNGSNYTESAKKVSKEVNKKEVTTKIEESEILTSLRVEADEKLEQRIDKLKAVLTNSDATTEDKNAAYEEMKTINKQRGTEEELEKNIFEEYKIKSFVKISGDQIKVVALSKTHDTKLANNIMRSIQKKQNKKMYISVQFQNS
jgi:hypothetical protein